MAHGSQKAVLTAIVANGVAAVLKFLAAAATGSAAMFNAAIHSLMDTLNQGCLLLGLRAAAQPADRRSGFGHGQKKHLWNLWSAIGLYSIGSGLGLAHAWHAWHQLGHVEPAQAVSLLGMQVAPFWINLMVLVIALLIAGYSFRVATGEFLSRMRADGESSPLRYLARSDDPTLVAVVLEDSVALVGLTLAALGIVLGAITANGAWDVGFSAVIAVMLGVVAFYLGWLNMRFPPDVADPEAEQAMRDVIAGQPQVERCHDIRSLRVGESHTVLVAEVELREEAMLPGLFDQMVGRREVLMSHVREDRRQDPELVRYVTARASVEATLARTEAIIDQLTAQVCARAPQVCHVTIEVAGLAPPQAQASPDTSHTGANGPAAS